MAGWAEVLNKNTLILHQLIAQGNVALSNVNDSIGDDKYKGGVRGRN